MRWSARRRIIYLRIAASSEGDGMDTYKKMLPIGVEFFDVLIEEGYYYVDKTGLIAELLRNKASVTLFTRPRRFGKSLNMSMLENFFSIDKDQSIFHGLKISEEKDLCKLYMGQYPVISISLKGIQADCYETARAVAADMICEAAREHYCLMSSRQLEEVDRRSYAKLLEHDMDDSTLYGSLRTLSRLLERHYGRRVILLIDEYDVPLAKAHAQGYYDPMITLIRNLFEQGLKSNGSLEMAVLTGCMRISKESIFTGLNNLRVQTISSPEFDEYYGFTDGEVRQMLEYYGLPEHYETVQEWYDGYRFGNTNIYCPWDVLNYVASLRADPKAFPENYWSNTSGNEVVRRFIRSTDTRRTRQEIERLVAGETVEKEIHQELTYRDMYDSIDNLWSVLYMTGYLTQRERLSAVRFRLAIPNREIRSIYTTQIMELFRDRVRSDGATVTRFCDALYEANAAEAEQILEQYLRTTISVRDTAVRREKKENFYHGILLGMLAVKDGWLVESNAEAGEGYSDILVEPEEPETGIVIEIKYAEDGNLEAGCRAAFAQMEEKRYADRLRDEGYEHILKYAVACYRKHCRIELQQIRSGRSGVMN